MATDKQTFIKDLRPFGGGTPVHYDINVAMATPLCSGEFVGWDGSNRTLGAFTRAGTTPTAKYVGISGDSLSGAAKLGNQTEALNLVKPFKVFTTGVHQVLGTAAETYKHGTAVYMSSGNTQKITTDSSGSAVQVGTVHSPDGTVYTGAVLVPILIDEYTKTQL